MKVSNWIVYAIAAIASAVLLVLWYSLGLYEVDAPVDLVVSIVWWAVIIVSIIIVIRLEKARKERIRNMYVGDAFVYNAEAGRKPYNGGEQLIATLQSTIDGLAYDFTQKDMDSLDKKSIRFIVKTQNYKENAWQGEIVTVGEDSISRFENKQELSSLLNSMK